LLCLKEVKVNNIRRKVTVKVKSRPTKYRNCGPGWLRPSKMSKQCKAPRTGSRFFTYWWQ